MKFTPLSSTGVKRIKNAGVASLALLVSTLAAVNSASAQVPPSVNEHYFNSFYISGGSMALDEETAWQEGIDDTMTYLDIAYEGQQNNLVYGAGISLYFYDDNASFNQYVEDYWSDHVSSESSDATSVNVFGEVGVSMPLAPGAYFDVVGGLEAVINSERSIPNCSDCYSEDIEVDSGFYVTPRLKYITQSGFSMALQYRHYLSGDVVGGPSLRLGWTFF